MNHMDPLDVSPANIAEYAQNRVSLLVRDFAKLGISPSVTVCILMARGVCKWFAVRRDLIRFKDMLKGEVRQTLAEITQAKATDNHNDLLQARGRLRALEDCRATIRGFCHSRRWRFPFDRQDGWQRALRERAKR